MFCKDSSMSKFILHHFDEINSTQDKAHAIIQSTTFIKPIAITTNMQTAGYGTQGRVWQSPVGNLYTTLCLLEKNYMQLARKNNFANNPILLAANIMQEAITKIANKKVDIKLPNDLLYEGKKCAGFLATQAQDAAGNEILCIGVGVNCKTAPETTQPTAHLNCEKDELLFAWIEKMIYNCA